MTQRICYCQTQTVELLVMHKLSDGSRAVPLELSWRRTRSTGMEWYILDRMLLTFTLAPAVGRYSWHLGHCFGSPAPSRLYSGVFTHLGSLQDKIEEDNSRHNNSEVRDIDDTLGVTPSEQLSVKNLPASNTETVIAGTDKCSGCEMRWNRDCEEWMKIKLLTH